METQVVEARTHGRYLVRPPRGAASGILIGFHGYLENAEKHLGDLQSIPGLDGWVLVAVDALHAFYASRSGSGRVARGWMTREMREEAIEDNVEYVRGILESVRTRFGWRLPVVAFGYSQGASMAWRAAVLTGHEIAACIALAGDLPPELADLPPQVPFPSRALIGRGEDDDWYSEPKLAIDRERLEARGATVETLTFAGGHEWTEAFRAVTSTFLATVAT